MRFLLILMLCSGIGARAAAQQVPAPKRELRAVWIATVGNIDWPSKQGLSAQQQQQEFINHLNYLQSHGFNAAIVQVRPAADALYPSPYEPWSRYLSGKQGQPPFPKYDPLEFMVRECHRRNMELHAWFNPYRALVASNANPNPADHATKVHPEWIIHYGGKSYFDPGNPEAREYILKVILDVVERYDIDAVHIDDYFYPYPVAGKPFPDAATYKKYATGQALDDWRRDNVNMFVSQLNANIKHKKNWVKFGVSPFGIWRNSNKDPEGSATRGASCYDDLYSDVRLWIDKKWLDYVAPQLYWERGHRVAAYDILLPWWKEHSGNRQLYIGLGVYRMVDAKGLPWNNAQELLQEIDDARKLDVDGLVFYSMSSFYKIGNELGDKLQQQYFGTIAIPPATPWPGHAKPTPPKLMIGAKNNSNWLIWNHENAPQPPQEKYLVYRFEGNEKINLDDATKILALTQEQKFSDNETVAGKHYRYAVTAVDRLWNESDMSNVVEAGTPEN
ncbi:MAG: family 10 glycosylhydrolase [Edaphocola sp.]